MNTYIKPCEQFPDEDYSFQMEFDSKDPETDDSLYSLKWNAKCESCFLAEECAEKILKLIAKKTWIDNKEFSLDIKKNW